MRFVILLALVLAGCCTCPRPAVDVDKLNAQSQARLQAQANRESQPQKELHPLWRGPWSDMRRDNLEKLRKLK